MYIENVQSIYHRENVFQARLLYYGRYVLRTESIVIIIYARATIKLIQKRSANDGCFLLFFIRNNEVVWMNIDSIINGI